ncbi:MAG: nucleoside hydrolase [Chloroflexota bacterium]|jgi:purine nucleosidase
MTRRFIIDTDTASDDAVAIMMALREAQVQVEAITVVYGNLPVEQGSVNARFTVELCGKDTPVYEGATRGLIRTPTFAYWFHGQDGMGNMHYPAPTSPPADGHAVDELIRRFKEEPGQIDLITLGPLTNVALALRQEPRLAEWVRACYVMGGNACSIGNVTPAAEFNIWCDPEAAKIVFDSGMKILMVGWENCRGEAALNDSERQMALDFGTELARFTIDSNRSATQANMAAFGEPGLTLPDPITVAIALNPAVCTARSWHHVDVALHEPTRGMTVVDQYGITEKDANIEVCWQIDIPLWKEMLYQAIR